MRRDSLRQKEHTTHVEVHNFVNVLRSNLVQLLDLFDGRIVDQDVNRLPECCSSFGYNLCRRIDLAEVGSDADGLGAIAETIDLVNKRLSDLRTVFRRVRERDLELPSLSCAHILTRQFQIYLCATGGQLKSDRSTNTTRRPRDDCDLVRQGRLDVANGAHD